MPVLTGDIAGEAILFKNGTDFPREQGERSFAYSTFAAGNTGTSGSASLQINRKLFRGSASSVVIVL
jgi:hypothetical protein